MTYRLFVDSSTGVDIAPEWNYQERAKKIETRHRASSGAEYVYKFGYYGARKFDVMYVSSADKTTINSWWAANTDLLFMEVGASEVFSCRLANDYQPIGELVKPYHDQWQGTIELEGY